MHPSEILIPIIAIIGFFSAVITYIYMKYRSTHQQRMALIESGKTADIFTEKKLDQRSNALKNGMLFTGAGIGLLLGFMLPEYTRLDHEIVFPLTLIGAGIGLILFYRTRSTSDDY